MSKQKRRGGAVGPSDREHARMQARVRRELIPKLESSAVFLSIAPEGEPDWKMCMEIGMALWLGKPIALVVTPGRTIPYRVRALADVVIEGLEIDDPRLADRIGHVVREFVVVEPEGR